MIFRRLRINAFRVQTLKYFIKTLQRFSQYEYYLQFLHAFLTLQGDTEHHPSSLAIGVFWTLTAFFHGVASLKVITSSRWVFPAAIRAFHVANLAAEGLQSGQDARVHRNNGGGVAVRKSLIFTELGRRRRAGVVICVAIKQLIQSSCRGSWGTRGTLGPRFTWGSL